MALCKYGPDGDCGRKTVVRDMCMTHYRRWRAWKPLDSPIRGYTRYAEGPDGGCIPAPTRPQAARRAAFAEHSRP
jgi:hypothetical protein